MSYCSRRVEADVRLMSDARPSDFNTFTLIHDRTRQDKSSTSHFTWTGLMRERRET